MKECPFCGYSNYDGVTVCRKCDNSFYATGSTFYQAKSYWLGPEKSKHLRSRALALIALGLLIKVYWGGYGPWPTIDFPILVSIRVWLEPALLFGGMALYIFGWIGKYV